MDYINVELTDYEMAMGEFIGTRRNDEAIRQGKKDSAGLKVTPEEGLNIHIEGACGELAFGKGMNFYYGGSVNTFKNGGDVAGIQVRTRSREDYDLLVRPHDPDNDAFVLLIGTRPNYRIYGWLLGKDAKKRKWKQTFGDRPPAYFVPKRELHDIFSLYKKIVLEYSKTLQKSLVTWFEPAFAE